MFTLINNDKLNPQSIKVKPVLIGTPTDSNVISVSFSGKKAVRGYYSYEHKLEVKKVAFLYLIWFKNRLFDNDKNKDKRQLFGEFINMYIKRGNHETYKSAIS